MILITLTIFGFYKIVNQGDESSAIAVEGAFSIIIIFGVLFGIIKFASKVSLGCSFAHMNLIETATVSTIYFCIPLIISLIIDMLGNALGHTLSVISNFSGILGISQAVVSVIFMVVGLYTVRTWANSKKNLTKKSSILMIFPCPGSIITIFTTAALLIIAGIDSFLVGIIIGGIFVAFIVLGGLIVKKLNIKRNPASFGGIMISFGILYVFSVLFIPAYIPVSHMELYIEPTPLIDLIPGISIMIVAIVLGFIFTTINFRRKNEVKQ